MNKPNNNENLPENTKSILIKSFFEPLLTKIGQSIGFVLGGLIISGIILLLLQHFVVPVVIDIVGEGTTNLAIATGAGATTAAVLATMLETPLVVAVGVGILVWWIVQQVM
jgi:hypothetical protein